MNSRSELFLDRKLWNGRVREMILWVVIGLSFSGMSLWTFHLTGDGKFVTTCFILGVGMTLVPLGIKMGHLILTQLGSELGTFLKSDKDEPEELFFSMLNDRFGRLGLLYFAGLIFGLLASIAFYQGGAFEFDPKHGAEIVIWLKCQMLGTIGMAGFMAGMALYLLIVMGSVVWALGNFKVTTATHKFGVFAVGRALVQIYAIAAAIWLVFSCSSLVGLRHVLIPLASLAGMSLLVFVGSFFVCLLPLHKRMVSTKRKLVIDAFHRLESLAQTPIMQRDDPHLKILAEAKREYSEAQDLPEWPIKWKFFVALVTSGFGSNLPVIIGVIVKYAQM